MTIRNRDKVVYTAADGIRTTGTDQNDYHTFADLLVFQFRYNVHLEGRSIWNEWRHCSFVEAINDGFYAEADENQALQTFYKCRFASNGRHGLKAYHTFANFLLDGWLFLGCTFEANLSVPIHIDGTFGIQNWNFIGCYGEENATSVSPGATGSIVKAGFMQVNAPYAIGLNLTGCTFAGNTSPSVDPDYYIYVADACVNVIGKIENCRGDTAAIIGVYWKRGLDFGANFNLTYAIDRTLNSRAAIESIDTTTFTPALAFSGGSTGITYSNQVRRYVINGNMVTFQAYVSLSSKGSSTGTVRLTGLPYAGKNVANFLQTVHVVVAESTTTKTQIHGQISPGNTYIEVQGISGSSIAALDNTELGNSTTFRISGSYFL